MHFISKPNLPQSRVKKTIIGKYPIIIDALNKLGTEVFISKNNSNLQKPVQSHADMTILHLGGENFLSYNDKITQKLNQMGAYCRRPQRMQCSSYPQDIVLNCLITDNFIVCNTKYCADEIIEFASANNKKHIFLSRGHEYPPG